MLACEETVCDDACMICHDAVTDAVTVMSSKGILFDSKTVSKRLDMNACVKPDTYYWSTIGSMNSRIVVTGRNKINNNLEYVLVAANTMTVLNRVTVSKCAAENNFVYYVRLLHVGSRAIVVGGRFKQYIDILQIVNDQL